MNPPVSSCSNLFAAARACIDASDPDAKIRLSRQVGAQWTDGCLDREAAVGPESIPEPGRPVRPRLVPPVGVPRRRLGSVAGRAALVHAITHIEFNAINLAWDAVYRFRDMPRAFYDDWVQVAVEEAYHFTLLRERLRELDHEYGDFDAHNGLWEMAMRTEHDVLLRMALVPRVLEARGLDVTPGMRARLEQAGDASTVAILDIILRDEVGHVAAGSRWFRYVCERRGLEPDAAFGDLIERHMKGRIKGPLHTQARLRAGFSEHELIELQRQAGRND